MISIRVGRGELKQLNGVGEVQGGALALALVQPIESKHEAEPDVLARRRSARVRQMRAVRLAAAD